VSRFWRSMCDAEHPIVVPLCSWLDHERPARRCNYLICTVQKGLPQQAAHLDCHGLGLVQLCQTCSLPAMRHRAASRQQTCDTAAHIRVRCQQLRNIYQATLHATQALSYVCTVSST
jgi:hypothetical protein